MKYWDSSAIIPLLLAEEASPRMDAVVRDDAAIVTWWGTAIECTSALARLEREGGLSPGDMRSAMTRLRHSTLGWAEVPANDDVRDQAVRLLRVHRLRAADAVQIAAAIVAADFQTGTLDFVTLDVRQGEAAEREGFRVTM